MTHRRLILVLLVVVYILTFFVMDSVIAYTATIPRTVTADPLEEMEVENVLPTTKEKGETDPTVLGGEEQKKETRASALVESESQSESVGKEVGKESAAHVVPFYSQFKDITPANWKKISCGVASLAMLIDFYQPAVSPDTLLQEGINSGAYIQNAGWSHAGLIDLAKKYGLTGSTHPLAHLNMSDAFSALKEAVEEGPVIVSVHYTFDPKNPIPHLVVVTGISDEVVYYNDPAEEIGGGTVSIKQFQSAWKKRYISIRPVS